MIYRVMVSRIEYGHATIEAETPQDAEAQVKRADDWGDRRFTWEDHTLERVHEVMAICPHGQTFSIHCSVCEP